ncbi:hypothetical protein G4V62_03340 [Bacillaceae bacterium SIJ1]|uniref:hypothetical protein n=1 Tax=Litoribacterium kuwaitense TaxID=1398745 RepID=UPI0013EC8E0A|nr:hypothetical protein [Litoribacterium kuwaitense]NGP44028.1 hypothetical protein [Litoribacterium kuwaitense]
MAFGIKRDELIAWKKQVSAGELAFLTHFWVHPTRPEWHTVTKAGCNDLEKLMAWGEAYGLQEKWIHHRPAYPHFDLLGAVQYQVLIDVGLNSHIERFRIKAPQNG